VIPSHGPEARRLLSPPRRRPGPLAVAVRWRRELLVAGVVGLAVWGLAVWGLAVWGLGPWVAVLLASVVVTALLALPPLRGFGRRELQAVVVPHRARTGLLQAGVASRTGKLPWIVTSRGRGDAVVLSLWLPAGVTVDDVDAAREVVAAACGAAEVHTVRPGPRRDRLLLVVVRPRWGWWGR